MCDALIEFAAEAAEGALELFIDLVLDPWFGRVSERYREWKRRRSTARAKAKHADP